jgi:hypothetical protein
MKRRLKGGSTRLEEAIKNMWIVDKEDGRPVLQEPCRLDV